MLLELPPGTEIATRIYGPIANLVGFRPQGWRTGSVPRSLLGPGRTDPIGLSVLSHKSEVVPDPLPLGQGLELTSSEIEVAALAERIAFVELNWRWTAGERAALSPRQLGDHWSVWYETFGSIEDRVLASTPLRGRHSAWRAPMTVITLADEEADLDRFDGFCSSVVGGSGAPVRAGGFLGRSSWDGAVIVTVRRRAHGDQAEALLFLMRAICADWEFHNEVLRVSRKLLVQPLSASANLDSTRAALRRMHTSLALVSPTALCYWDGHRQTVEATWEGWKRADLNATVVDLIDRVHQLYQLDVDAERSAMAANDAVRVEILNRTVAWLGLLGVASTVAGIVSTLDYDNSTVDKLWRAIVIVASALVAVAAFTILVRRAVRGAKATPD